MVKKGIPMTKTFDKKRYAFYGTYENKRRANTIVHAFRAGGDSARVTVIEGEPCVYVKRKRR